MKDRQSNFRSAGSFVEAFCVPRGRSQLVKEKPFSRGSNEVFGLGQGHDEVSPWGYRVSISKSV